MMTTVGSIQHTAYGEIQFKGLYGPDDRLIVPAEEIKKPKVKRAHVIRYFSHAEEKKLLGLLDSLKSDKAARDRVVMETGFGLGLRVKEVCGLTVGQVRNQENLTVVCKGSKERIIPIPKRLQRLIKDHLKRKLLWNEGIRDEDPLFVSQIGNRLSKRSMQEMFENWCKRAGFVSSDSKASYTFHCMRHTFAMRLREKGYTIEDVADLMGHSSLNSTRIYFRMTLEEMREAVNSI